MKISAFRKEAGLKRPIGGTFFTANPAQKDNGGSGGNGGNNNNGNNGNGGNGRSAASLITAGSCLVFITLFTSMFIWM